VINNCLNVSARHCAVGAQDWQQIDYRKTRTVAQISIDSPRLNRLDLVKIDVEGTEEEGIRGAVESLRDHA
jgi:hypothetical protein